MPVIVSIFLGIVHGIAEFIPVSVSGHLSILQNLLGLDYAESDHLFFNVMLNLGTLVSIFTVFKNELKNMISDGLGFLRSRADFDEPTLKPPARTLLFILLGTIPMLIVLIFAQRFGRLFYNTWFVGFALLVTGALLFVADRYIKPGTIRDKNITIKDALMIGLVQAIAILPGMSRSGATISAGIARGFNKSFAVRFSIMLSIPMLIGSTIWTLLRAISAGLDLSHLPAYFSGFIMTATVGYFAIQILRRIVASDGGLSKCAYYCWGVGVIAIVLTLAV